MSGPFGRWYPFPQGDFIVIAGGIGLASVYYLMKRFPKRAYLFYGVREEREILFYDELREITKEMYISTEMECPYTYKGIVTELVKEKCKNLSLPIYACGPMVMLKELKKSGKRISGVLCSYRGENGLRSRSLPWLCNRDKRGV